MIKFRHRGGFDKTENFLKSIEGYDALSLMHRYGRAGVEVLAMATPRDTGTTSKSWTYEVVTDSKRSTIIWKNTNVSKDGFPIALYIQYGHGTRGGGYVQGIDFINPAMERIFQRFAEDLWKEVQSK